MCDPKYKKELLEISDFFTFDWPDLRNLLLANPQLYSDEVFNRWLADYKGKDYIMYRLDFSEDGPHLKSIIISKSTHEMMGYTSSELAEEITIYKGLAFEICTDRIFRDGFLTYYRTFFKHAKLLLGKETKLSAEEIGEELSYVIENSKYTGKNNLQIDLNVKVNSPEFFVCCHDTLKINSR